MAQLLMQGTNYLNFIGRYCWVAAGEHGLYGVVVTERDEPQAVIGSTCTSSRSPTTYEKHVERGGDARSTPTSTPASDIGEACSSRSRSPRC